MIEHRWSYALRDEVPEEPYVVPIGRAHVARSGTDCTVVAASFMVTESMRAAEQLEAKGISAEVIDLRSIRPWDVEAVSASVRRTGRLVVADPGWGHFGLASEVSAVIAERAFDALRAPVQRVALPDVPTPCAPSLEMAYYPVAANVVTAVERALGHQAELVRPVTDSGAKPFSGAF
jgi:pyruvate dehydrogenase E1 component beta subunit